MPRRKLNNIAQRADGRWLARKVFGYRPDGLPNRKAFYGDTAAEASQKLADYERQIENGLNVDSANITFGKWLDLWLREYKFKMLRPRTYDTYEMFITSRITPALGKHKLLKLRPEHLQSFINDLKKENDEPISDSMTKQIKCVISSALGQAVKNGLITRNPADALSLPKNGNKKKVGAFTFEEQATLLNQVKNHKLYALFVLALGTGLRAGEILALRWSNLDLNKNELTVSATLSRAKSRKTAADKPIGTSLMINAPKTKTGNRTVPLTREVKQALIKHKEAQAVERLRAGNAWTNNDLVFCTALGGYLEYRNIKRLYYVQRDKVGLPPLGFHCLRHTFATNAVSAGVDYYYLSRIMGHANISITLDTYTEFMPDQSRSEMEKMEGVLLRKFA